MAERLRRQIESTPRMVTLNDYNHGPVTLFRVYPSGVDAKEAYASETRDASKAADLRAA